MEWQPIETAPRDRTVVLLRGRGMRHADGFWEPEAYAGNGAWVWPYVHCEPTNWMPLPGQEVGAGDTAVHGDILLPANAEVTGGPLAARPVD